MHVIILVIVLLIVSTVKCEIDNSFMPTKCEICALVAKEFDQRASKVHKRLSSEFADLTDHFCQGFNEFKIHKEKEGLGRFSRQPSKTIETLKQMRDKGVKVELGMPYEMWDQPSAEIFALRQGCETILEDYEDLIEIWFLERSQLKKLFEALCKKNYLKNEDSSCFEVGEEKHEKEEL